MYDRAFINITITQLHKPMTSQFDDRLVNNRLLQNDDRFKKNSSFTTLVSDVLFLVPLVCKFAVTFVTLIWQATKFAVFSLSGYSYVGDGGTDWREMLHDGTYWAGQVFSLF